MSDEQLVLYCSPTLAGLKTGSLFMCSYCAASRAGKENDSLSFGTGYGMHSLHPLDREQIVSEFRDYNRDLNPKGLRMIPLRIQKGRVLTYLYRPAELEKDFETPACRTLLNELGYEGLNPEECIVLLRERLQSQSEFPHEIGLFLGYPPEDVRGFIENEADSCKCTGHWKVYGDESAAKKRFQQYDCCTACYLQQLANGVSIDRLAVAV